MNHKNKIWLKKKYLDEGLSSFEIAPLCEVADRTIRKYISKFGLNKTPSEVQQSKLIHLTKEQVEFAYNNSHNKKETAEKLGIGKGALKTLFKKFDIKDKPKTLPRKVKRKIARRGSSHHFYGMTGSLSPNWQGGKTKLDKLIRSSEKYKKWKIKIWIRDNRACVLCNSKKEIEIDHTKPLYLILKENNINNQTKANRCSELWDVDNGRVLCKECHINTPTWGPKVKQLTQK